MATPTAIGFISGWDYLNATDADLAKFKERADDFPRRVEWAEDDLRSAFLHLQQVLCNPQFPLFDGGPAALTKNAFDWTLEQMDYKPVYHDDYATFFLKCISSGPNLTQIEMMTKITTRNRMRDYLQSLSGQKLIDFIRGLKKKFDNHETLSKDYCSKLSSALRSNVFQSFEQKQAEKHRPVFVELLMFYQSQVPEADEHFGQLYYSQLVSSIERLLGREKWKGLDTEQADPSPFLLREQLKSINTLAKSGKYPAYGDQPNHLKYCLRNCLEIIRQNKVYFPLYIDDVMHGLCVCAKLPPSEAIDKILDPYSSFIGSLGKIKDDLKKMPELFDKYAPMLTNLLLDIPNSQCLASMIRDLHEDFLAVVGGSANKPAQVKMWMKWIAALLIHPHKKYLETCERLMKNQKKLLKWKENVDEAHLILTTIAGLKMRPSENDKSRFDDMNPEGVGRTMADVTEELLKQLKTHKLLPEVQPDILNMIKQILEDRDPHKFPIAKELCEFIELKNDMSLALPAIQTYDKLFKDEDFPWTHWALVGVSMDLLTKVISAHKDPEQFKPYAPYFVSIFKTAMNSDFWDHDSGSKNVFGYILIGPLINLGALYRATKDHSDLQPMLGDTVRMLTCDDEDIVNGVSNMFMMVSMASPALFAPFLKDILQAYFDNENSSLLNVIQSCYKLNPAPVNEEFEKVFDLLDSVETNSKSSVLMILKEIADHNPQIFTKDRVNTLFESYLDDQMTQATVLQLLQSLSQKAQDYWVDFVDVLFSHMTSLIGIAMIPPILVNICHKQKKQQKRIFDGFVNLLKTYQGDFSAFGVVLYAIRQISGDDRDMLKPHRKLFVETGEKHTNTKDMCKLLVDIIDGKSVDAITDKIEQQQEDIGQLDVRVTNTQNEVTVIGQEVESQGQKVGELRQDVNKQGGRIDELEVVVDDTVIKVEEIDNKTLNNAPVWSRDVSKLLNVDSEHDWRLLAQRLGYSAEDIRGWATQHDPCMSALSEWFATHKTSEATKAVLNILEEMNRLDAAEIVGRAMKAVENVIQDEPPDYENPPPIFLSYQWGHQGEVRTLRNHLEMAGFESWMDIGQMGGGDKLYAKIDEGIRASKVVICCVTEKYAKSPNCNREVNLAVNLGKPIIPILLESVSWPPPGSMGPIFGEYLYIRFFVRESQNSVPNDLIWPKLSFRELLMQLSYMKLIPEHSKIKPPYEKWWLPPEEVIVINKDKSGNKKPDSTVATTEEVNTAVQPDVFISYQWGIQPEVKSLYKRLSTLGYHCWMDIHQMGGGDSLYDKIDRGVRGCKVVLSCVTDKYSKSANCRREVSLADALKKPIVPLLLEDTVWPPSGPMSMVFTQLLYIDFKNDESRSSWEGPKFEELLTKIKSYLPKTVADPKTPIESKQSNQPTQAKQPSQTTQPKQPSQAKLRKEPSQPVPPKQTSQDAQTKQTTQPKQTIQPKQTTKTTPSKPATQQTQVKQSPQTKQPKPPAQSVQRKPPESTGGNKKDKSKPDQEGKRTSAACLIL